MISAPQMQMPTMPQSPEPAPVFGIKATKPKAKSQQTPYLGTDTVPSQANAGWKTLLGQ